jgi:hypothetical protein
MQMTARPTGPQPITIATSLFVTSARRTACHPTASGSVSTASLGDRPFGSANISDSSTTTCSAYPPGAAAARPIACTCAARRVSGTATTGVPVVIFLRVLGP